LKYNPIFPEQPTFGLKIKLTFGNHWAIMMKTPIVRMSLGLFGAAITASGAIGYLAWDSLRGESNLAPVATTAQSQPTVVSPINGLPIDALPTSSTSLANSTAQSQPVQIPQAQTPQAQTAAITTSAAQSAENNYLFDLSQALQAVEYQRLSAAEQLEIARQIQSWVEAGADFWSLRQRFDASYGTSVAGNYPHNRDVYIRFATERFAPAYLATLMQPPGVNQQNGPFGQPFNGMPAMPYPEGYEYAPYPEPDLAPYPGAPNYSSEPYPEVPYPQPYSGNPYGDPYSSPYGSPNLPQVPYGNPYPQPNPQPNPQQNPYSQPNQPNQNPAQIPNVTEVST
jgi:hypothetical protein